METENSQIIKDEHDRSLESDDSEVSLDSQRFVEEKVKDDEPYTFNFEKICESIDEEERLLNQLEERRKKLEVDMERLEKEIEDEKRYFREAIDNEIAIKKEISSIGTDKSKTVFFNVGQFQSKFQEYRDIIHDSAESSNACEDDAELERLKSNLVSYRKTLDDTKKEKFNKQKKKAAAKLFQRHLEEVDIKCDEQMDKLVTIQKSIEKIGDGNVDVNGESA